MEEPRHEGGGAEAARKPLPQRACEECKRKKTKCDMKQPICSLCDRIGFDCVYPTRRKPPTRNANTAIKKSSNGSKVDNDKLSRLIDLLDNDKLDNLLSAQNPPTLASGRSASDASSEVPPSHLTSGYQVAAATPSWLNDAYDPNSSANFPQTPFLSNPFTSSIGSSIGSVQANNVDTEMNMTTAVNQNLQAPFVQGIDQSPYAELLKQQAGAIDWTDSSMTDLFQNFNQIVSTPWQVPGEETSASPESWLVAAESQNAFPLTVHADVADHLIDLYFQKIRGMLPLFHRPSFHNHVLRTDSVSEDRYQHLDWQACLVLNGMFTLAVRFSPRDDIFGQDVKDRAIPFEKRSVQLWDYARRTNAGDNPDLRYLQGCLLVATHQLTTGPGFRAWLATGVCVRMAYDLSLHIMDRHGADPDRSPSDWAKDEEKRRAWWAVFEIDTFASTISCRPFVTDMNRMHVLLPVSDDAWFSGRPVVSAKLLSSGPGLAWKSLVGCENQCEHAWFIVSNYIMRSSHEILENGDLTEETLENLLSAMQCLVLSLPKNFKLSNIAYDENNFGEMNWIIHTLWMVQSANIFVAIVQNDDPEPANIHGTKAPEPHHDNRPTQTPYERAMDRCSRYTYEIYRICRYWSPDYIHQSFPFMACLLLGPAGINLSRAPQPVQIDGRENPRFLQRHLLDLVLDRVAEYWVIGGLLQELVQFMDAWTPVDQIAKVRPELARFRVISPEIIKGPLPVRGSSSRPAPRA